MTIQTIPNVFVPLHDCDDRGPSSERIALAAVFIRRHLPEITTMFSMRTDDEGITLASHNRELLLVAASAIQACGSTRVDHIPHPLR